MSVVIPTKDRPDPLVRTIESLLASTVVPAEFVIVDASSKDDAMAATMALFDANGPRLVVQRATKEGAAAQRNQGVALASNDYVLFCDDDIVCETDCVERLWITLRSDAGLGGASAAIINQSYRRPGRAMRMVLRTLGEPEGESYAGRIVGPAIAFLPELSAREDAVPVQWLNLGCTLYRRSVLPAPPFDTWFEGYSIGEDIALSLRVARKGRLVNVPAARVHHDSQPGAHKADPVALSRMDVVNRHTIMTRIMDKRGWRDAARLVVWTCWQLAVSAWQQRGGRLFWQRSWGALLGFSDIMRGAQGRR